VTVPLAILLLLCLLRWLTRHTAKE
jgi:hypothetical protein